MTRPAWLRQRFSPGPSSAPQQQHDPPQQESQGPASSATSTPGSGAMAVFLGSLWALIKRQVVTQLGRLALVSEPREGALEPASAPDQGRGHREGAGDESGEQPSFAAFCNEHRAPLDPILDAFVLLTYGVLRWWDKMHADSMLAYAGHVALHLVRAVWAAKYTKSYLQYWRQPVVALLTAATMASPIPTVVLLDMARGLGAAASALSAPPSGARQLTATAGAMFISRAQKMAILALGYRLRLPLYLPLHAASLALAHVRSVCSTVLAGQSLGPPRASPLEQAAVGAAAAVVPVPAGFGAWSYAMSTFSGTALLFLLPLPPSALPALSRMGPIGQCRAVVAWLQVAVGTLLPAAMHVVGESREYLTYCQLYSPAARAQAGGRLHSFYLWVGSEVEGKLRKVQLGTLLAMLLAALWMVIQAVV